MERKLVRAAKLLIDQPNPISADSREKLKPTIVGELGLTPEILYTYAKQHATPDMVLGDLQFGAHACMAMYLYNYLKNPDTYVILIQYLCDVGKYIRACNTALS